MNIITKGFGGANRIMAKGYGGVWEYIAPSYIFARTIGKVFSKLTFTRSFKRGRVE